MHVGFVVYAGEFDELCAVGAGMLLDLAEKLPAESLVLIPSEDDDLLQPIARKVVVGLEIPDRVFSASSCWIRQRESSTVTIWRIRLQAFSCVQQPSSCWL